MSKIINKETLKIDGTPVLIVSRMESRGALLNGTQFTVEAPELKLSESDSKIDDAKQRLNVKIREVLAAKDFEEFFIVTVDHDSDISDRGRGYAVRSEFSWTSVLIGKYPDGRVCHKVDQTGRVMMGMPDMDGYGDFEQKSLVKATPEVLKTLKSIAEGYTRLQDKMKALMHTDKIQKTLASGLKLLPAPEKE